mgnify:CR=1 FL=1
MRSRTSCANTLDDEERGQLERRLACNVARRLAHLPLAGIRAAAPCTPEPDALEAFFAAASQAGAPALIRKNP